MNLVLQTCLSGDASNFCRLSFCECFDHGPGYDCQWDHDGCSDVYLRSVDAIDREGVRLLRLM